jgi:DNA-binding HxlR family transcriptional regulator
MRSYSQFCPVARGAEIFAERWTPLILRELLAGVSRYGELVRGLPGIPRHLLVQRLVGLEYAGVLERQPLPRGRGYEYRLTEAGEALRPVIHALGAWGYEYAAALRDEDLDPGLILWVLHRRLHVERMPDRQIVIRFDFHGVAGPGMWLVVNRPEVDVCHSDPGFEVDLTVTTDTATLTLIYLGRLGMGEALRRGGVELDGPRAVTDAFPGWLGLSPFARRDAVTDPA